MGVVVRMVDGHVACQTLMPDTGVCIPSETIYVKSNPFYKLSPKLQTYFTICKAYDTFSPWTNS